MSQNQPYFIFNWSSEINVIVTESWPQHIIIPQINKQNTKLEKRDRDRERREGKREREKRERERIPI